MTVEFSIGFVIPSQAVTFKDHDGTFDGCICCCQFLDEVDIAGDINSRLVGRRNLKFRQIQMDIVKIRYCQIQSGTLARIQRNGDLELCVVNIIFIIEII